ncbi:MAG: [Fe-Fe] hydrogenase large subunit C-terminal domain-containing protein [Bacteroidota bacterium]|nr:[Fe-Fe] hydrogenase large subunit C-terminal domain-containing protein [Bacteroidota bacterium]
MMCDFDSNISRNLVYTVKNRCRVCYTCVRECPAKAIKIINGQAEIINERCIACGNCTKVCSQGAKVFLNTKEYVLEILKEPKKNIAIVAPSFPAEFDYNYKILVGMIKKLGFDIVSEVAFGADLVAAKYRELIDKSKDQRYISSDCPAVVAFIKKYHPVLVDNLIPVVSPMVAMARVVKEKYGDNINIVFIGPCIAKKSESNELTEMLTYKELHEIFESENIKQDNVNKQEFDPPLAGKGAVFPVSRGLLQTAGIKDDVLDGNVIVADGRKNFQEAIKEFELGAINTKHLEVLACDGCINGAGMTTTERQYSRMIYVNNYVKNKAETFDKKKWKENFLRYKNINLLPDKFEEDDKRIEMPSKEDMDKVYKSMGKLSSKDMLNCGACGYNSCEEHAIAVVKGLAENEMCLPLTIEKLHNSINELAVSNDKLVSMQQVLRQTEKMASMGQLSAGIAHELNNPLGVVIMYANILLDEAGNDSQLSDDLKLIVEQTNRCKKIVGGLLNFARKNQVNSSEVDVREMIKQSINAVVFPDNVSVEINKNDLQNPNIDIDQEQMTQVISNLIKNAIDAMPEGGKILITIYDNANEVVWLIKDIGCGINEEDIEKIFEPFYTTKGIGKGTGLGLATAYGIVKMHKGQITVKSNTKKDNGETGTEFKIVIPRNK